MLARVLAVTCDTLALMPITRVFIGSSGEQRALVDWLTDFMRRQFQGVLEPVPWTIPFPGGNFTLETLLNIVNTTDAAILFCTPDDKTWYRDNERQEPRDNLVFEAGLFIAAHGRQRTQLMLPRYPSGDSQWETSLPSDLHGVTWNGFTWIAGAVEVESTGLPNTASRVCKQLASMGPRPRTTAVAPTLVNHDRVENCNIFCGDWHTVNIEVVQRLARAPSANEIDILAAYRVGEIRRVLDEFRTRSSCRLRACFADMWDTSLAEAYQRKYFDRSTAQLQEAVTESLRYLLGPCEINNEPSATAIRNVQHPPAATYDLRLTRQRITFGFYRVDRVLVMVPLDMKTAQNPAPYAWVIDASTSPRTFEHYLTQFETMFSEAQRVYPGS